MENFMVIVCDKTRVTFFFFVNLNENFGQGVRSCTNISRQSKKTTADKSDYLHWQCKVWKDEKQRQKYFHQISFYVL